MSLPDSDGAVGYFSRNHQDFHANYASAGEFKERLVVWDDILGRMVKPGVLALDMGCGSGVFSFRMAELGARVVGVDGSPEMVAFCEKQRKERHFDGMRFIQGTLPHVKGLEPASADLLISSSVVEYVDDLDATLALFSNLLRPGAPLVISMPNVRSVSRNHQRLKFRLTGQPEVYRHIKHFLSARALSTLAAQSGLVHLETHYYAHLTRIARVSRRLRLPPALTADLFVSVFQKRS